MYFCTSYSFLRVAFSICLPSKVFFFFPRCKPLTKPKTKTDSSSKNKVRTTEGTAVVRDFREASKIGVSFSYCELSASSLHSLRAEHLPTSRSPSPLLPVTPYSPYWVLSTDYTSVSVIYSCTDILRIFHIDYAWILGRSRFLPRESVWYAKELLMSEGIDLFRMKATDQTGCKDD